MDIIVLYCEQWDTPLRTSKHHYVERLAADGHRILYVEMPANPLSVARRWTDFSKRIFPLLKKSIEQVDTSIWTTVGFVPIPFHPILGSLLDNRVVNHLNQLVSIRFILRAAAKLQFVSPTIISYYPFAMPVLDRLAPKKIVFHMVDEWQGIKGIPRSMASLTADMLRVADTTIVTSRRLFDRYAPIANRIELLRHGTDLSLFSPVATGELDFDQNISPYSGIKIGYYGALHKLDFELVRRVAGCRQDWTFLFVGPEAGGQGVESREELPPNVVFLGAYPRDRLPQFLAGIDAFWMPFIVNELTHSMCPIKIFEVLSAGIPFVATDLDESREVAGEMGLFASDEAGHLQQLEEALTERRRKVSQRYSEHAAQFDWDKRYMSFLKILQCEENSEG